MITVAQAKEALDDLDDYARMGTGVDAFGPRKVLEDLIELVEAYDEVIRHIAFIYSAGGYNSEGLIDPKAAKNKLEYALEESARICETHLMQSHVGLMDAASAKHRIAQAESVRDIAVRDRDHWKANHDNVTSKLAIATQRPDLPVDRIPAIKELERLQALVAKPAPDINKLTRFDQCRPFDSTSTYMTESADGNYVRFDDVQALHAQPSQQPAPIADDDGPEFTVEDTDLDALLNAAADYAKGKNQNMDTGLHLMSLIERVQDRLKAAPLADAAMLDTERLDYMQEKLLRKSSMRFGLKFKEVNAWAIAAEGTDLRTAVDDLRQAQP